MAVEALSRPIVLQWIGERVSEGRIVIDTNDFQAEETRLLLQKLCGDLIVQRPNGGFLNFELKSEKQNKYGNLFIETWSNRSRRTIGWAITSKCDCFLYHFVEDRVIYSIRNWKRFQAWCFDDGNIYRFPEREQKERNQPNDTWGRCIPVKLLVSTGLVREFRLTE
jgi:hypothetical protein